MIRALAATEMLMRFKWLMKASDINRTTMCQRMDVGFGGARSGECIRK